MQRGPSRSSASAREQCRIFWIVGRDPRPEVIALDRDDVHVAGQVDEVIPHYQRCPICVVPLRAGGTHAKIPDHGAWPPVVSTSIGPES
ncbi:glycosyltransferase family 4 protein [Candidatus Villigracilis affinis]|uniref:glycosyltransferase family 4 protein n=1 Tax=Candidatus Villigracilis affinis TaxID=3140682 RepID=UPI002A21129D|nr:glycosyltransferase family 4 protein [Anaerolineales bacterium]